MLKFLGRDAVPVRCSVSILVGEHDSKTIPTSKICLPVAFNKQERYVQHVKHLQTLERQLHTNGELMRL